MVSHGRRSRWAPVLAIGLSLGVAPVWGSGIASASTKHETSKAPTVKQAGKHYLAIVAPANAAVTEVNKAVSGDSPTTSFATLGQQVAPMSAALTTLDQRLTNYTWPKAARTDVRTLLSDDAQLIGVLSSASGQNSLSGSSWLTTFDSDVTQLGTAADEVRHDLGLPPAKG